MLSFKEFLEKERAQERFALFEHETYKQIPGTKKSYRQDPANTNTITQKHSHVYAKLGGKGSQIYSVNYDGSGHDGSSGKTIPSSHADHLRSLGYEIAPDNILEVLEFDQLNSDQDVLVLVESEA